MDTDRAQKGELPTAGRGNTGKAVHKERGAVDAAIFGLSRSPSHYMYAQSSAEEHINQETVEDCRDGLARGSV